MSVDEAMKRILFPFQNIAEWCKTHQKDFCTWAIFYPLSKLFFGAIDWMVYPACVYFWGLAASTIVISLFLLLCSWVILVLYAHYKRDLFGLEAEKKLLRKRKQRVGWNPFSWIHINRQYAWILLVWHYQPYKVVIFHRYFAYDYEMTGKDIERLLVFWLLRTIHWVGLMYLGESFFVVLWQKMFH